MPLVPQGQRNCNICGITLDGVLRFFSVDLGSSLTNYTNFPPSHGMGDVHKYVDLFPHLNSITYAIYFP